MNTLPSNRLNNPCKHLLFSPILSSLHPATANPLKRSSASLNCTCDPISGHSHESGCMYRHTMHGSSATGELVCVGVGIFGGVGEDVVAETRTGGATRQAGWVRALVKELRVMPARLLGEGGGRSWRKWMLLFMAAAGGAGGCCC